MRLLAGTLIANTLFRRSNVFQSKVRSDQTTLKRISRVAVVSLLALGLCRLNADEPKATKSKTQPSVSKSNSPVLVRVNGQPITEADLDFFAKSLKLAADDDSQRREQLMERLIDRQLLRAFLTQKKVAANSEQLDAHLTRLKTRLKERGEDFDKLLAKSGFTESSLRRELSLPLDWEAYVHKTLSDAQLKSVWQQRKHEFDGSEVRAAQIVLKSDDLAADEKKLSEVRQQIVSGKLSFADAAKKHSQAPSGQQGGDLGRFGFRGKQPPPYPQVAFGLKVGDVSEPIRSPFGVLLLTVTERSEGQLSLEDARPEILQQLSIEMQRDVLAQERAKAKIERVKG